MRDFFLRITNKTVLMKTLSVVVVMKTYNGAFYRCTLLRNVPKGLLNVFSAKMNTISSKNRYASCNLNAASGEGGVLLCSSGK